MHIIYLRISTEPSEVSGEVRAEYAFDWTMSHRNKDGTFRMSPTDTMDRSSLLKQM